MQVKQFREFLEQQNAYTDKAISTRISKLKKAESILGVSLDILVEDDDKMYDALVKLRQFDDLSHAPLQNPLRKYYQFKRGKEFPQLRYYKR